MNTVSSLNEDDSIVPGKYFLDIYTSELCEREGCGRFEIVKSFNLACQIGERLGFRKNHPCGCYCLGIASKAQLLKK